MSGFQNPGASFSTLDSGVRGSAMRYPHPFFDVAQTYLPVTVKHLFRWCHTYYQMNGLINSVVNKMAQYPVTKLQFKARDKLQEALYTKLFADHLNLEQFCIACNVDYYVFGNAYVSIHYPIVKYLTCPRCSHKSPADATDYKFEAFEFVVQRCARCGSTGLKAKVTDIQVPAKEKIRLVRWNPELVDVKYNEITGDAQYVLTVPQNSAQSIREGNPLFLNHTPQVFIDAVAKSQAILLSPYNIYHMRRENVAGKDMGLGQPLVMPALKDLFLMQVLKKSQEAIANEHIIPLRIIHPAASGNTDPASTMDLGLWQNTIRSELLRWRQDPNYTPIVPLPIGFQYMGGQGKSLLLTNELKQIGEAIVTSMGVPVEFAFGGMSFSGSSISLRMLENQFLRNQTQQTKLVSFIVNSISRFLGIEPCIAEFTSIRTADDVQRKQILVSLAQANKLSNRTLLSEFNLDLRSEQDAIESEQKVQSRLEARQFLNNAENQGKASLIQSRYQTRAQQQVAPGAGGEPQGQPQDPGSGGNGDAQQVQTLSPEEVQKFAASIQNMRPDARASAIEKLKAYVDPASVDAILQALTQAGARKDQREAMRPLPNKLPPRRGAGRASV